MSELDKMDQVMKAALLVGAAKLLPEGSEKRLEFLAAAQQLLGPDPGPLPESPTSPSPFVRKS